MKEGPLAGVRIIDLTQMLAGPFCTMLLADLGAEVIKIEPLEGDLIRKSGGYHPEDRLRDYGGYFQSINRNKKGLALDLRRPEAQEIVRRLVRTADALVENFRPGVMERLGLSYEALREENPRLVYGCVRGFGDPRTGRSPYAEWPCFDIVAQAMGGLMGITGPGPGQPTKVGPGIGDIFPGTLMALGLLAAILHARETGRGQFLDVAMYDAILALCERIVWQHSYLGLVPGPEGNHHPFTYPFDTFPTRDGWVTIAAPTERQWQRLCEAMGRPDLAQDPELSGGHARSRQRERVREAITAWTSARTKREVVQALGGIVPCGPVNTVEDIFQDEHMARREMLVQVEHPGVPSPTTIVGVPIKLTETPGKVRARAPLLGEHTRPVLQELGYSDEEIEALERAGVIKLPRLAG
jgi:crotonobetainyl-CoA:carnitine CoA-transferase CaiB-like acyl-CoA transferase